MAIASPDLSETSRLAGMVARNRYIERLAQHERLNFLLTNRIPRRWATLFMARFSRIEQPFVRRLSFRLWRLFGGDFELHEAKQTQFRSLHDCFTRELKEGVRPLDADPDVVVSPCDGIVGAHGDIDGTEVLQAKGFPYTLPDLLADSELADKYRDGTFVTLRLQSRMYHRFHAPCDCHVRRVRYISGDTWNVNPIALKRIERLYCKNERAVIDLELDRPKEALALVPVAAILVASIHLGFLNEPLTLRYRGSNSIGCDGSFSKGDEMGHFEHGSTIIVLASPSFALCPGIEETARIRMGEPLLRRRAAATKP